MAEKRTRLSDMTKAGRKAEKPTVIGAIRDPQFVRDVLQGLGETATRGITGVLGAPVDITTMAMRPFGYSVPAEQVVGGSEYLGKQLERAGMLSGNRNQLSELLAGLVTPDPVDAAKLGAMFIGPLAKTWDAEAAAKAARMELEGADPRAIWAETGTWKGPEGKWRQEIPDNELKKIYNTEEIFDPRKFYQDEAQRISNLQEKIGKEFNAGKIPKDDAWAEYNRLKGLKEEALKKAEQYYSPGLMISRVGEDIPFEQVFQHEQLQRAYDQLPTVAFTKNLPFEGAGSYSKGRIQTSLLNNPPESVMAHELQHAIQQREGFAGGGNPEQFENINNSITSLADQAKTYDVAYLLKEKMQNGMSLADAKKAYFDETGIKVPEGAASIARYNSLDNIANNKRDTVLRINELSNIAQYSPYEAYRRLAGEAEARATEARLGMTAAERRAKFPEESYDVPIRELIFR